MKIVHTVLSLCCLSHVMVFGQKPGTTHQLLDAIEASLVTIRSNVAAQIQIHMQSQFASEKNLSLILDVLENASKSSASGRFGEKLDAAAQRVEIARTRANALLQQPDNKVALRLDSAATLRRIAVLKAENDIIRWQLGRISSSVDEMRRWVAEVQPVMSRDDLKVRINKRLEALLEEWNSKSNTPGVRHRSVANAPTATTTLQQPHVVTVITNWVTNLVTITLTNVVYKSVPVQATLPVSDALQQTWPIQAAVQRTFPVEPPTQRTWPTESPVQRAWPREPPAQPTWPRHTIEASFSPSVRNQTTRRRGLEHDQIPDAPTVPMAPVAPAAPRFQPVMIQTSPTTVSSYRIVEGPHVCAGIQYSRVIVYTFGSSR